MPEDVTDGDIAPLILIIAVLVLLFTAVAAGSLYRIGRELWRLRAEKPRLFDESKRP